MMLFALLLSLTGSYVKAEPPKYFWPTGRGTPGSYGVSPYSTEHLIGVPPYNGTMRPPTWTWHDPKGRFSDIPVGLAIDDKKDIYVTLATGVKKFSTAGQLLWTYDHRSTRVNPYDKYGKLYEEISNAASLVDGKIIADSSFGRIFALDMK